MRWDEHNSTGFFLPAGLYPVPERNTYIIDWWVLTSTLQTPVYGFPIPVQVLTILHCVKLGEFTIN